jgi:hypothetical protein
VTLIPTSVWGLPDREVIPAGREPFLSAAQTLLDDSGCVVRRWRRNLSGTAYTKSADWEIEAPTPTTALRFAILAHEVGHQMLHRGGSKQRWQEEFEAWEYAFARFDEFGLPGRGEVAGRAYACGQYAMDKALRRATRPETKNAILRGWQRFYSDVLGGTSIVGTITRVELGDAVFTPGPDGVLREEVRP